MRLRGGGSCGSVKFLDNADTVSDNLRISCTNCAKDGTDAYADNHNGICCSGKAPTRMPADAGHPAPWFECRSLSSFGKKKKIKCGTVNQCVYLGVGYNIIAGDPHADLDDPGWAGRIFDQEWIMARNPTRTPTRILPGF